MKISLIPSLMYRHKQTGISLFIALISLVAMTLAGIALIRAVDTTNVISGNFAFRQASLHTTDVGIEAAITALNTIVTTSLDANYPSGCATGACNYYPTRQTINSAGIPTSIDWTAVPSTTIDSSYKVQYVIDRLCDGPTPVTDVSGKCMRTSQSSVGSKKAGAVSFTSASQVYYRTTIRVVGPRNTSSIVQTIIYR